MYVEKTNTGYNIMDIDRTTLVAIEKMVTTINLDQTEIGTDGRQGLIDLKVFILTELRNLTERLRGIKK